MMMLFIIKLWVCTWTYTSDLYVFTVSEHIVLCILLLFSMNLWVCTSAFTLDLYAFTVSEHIAMHAVDFKY